MRKNQNSFATETPAAAPAAAPTAGADCSKRIGSQRAAVSDRAPRARSARAPTTPPTRSAQTSLTPISTAAATAVARTASGHPVMAFLPSFHSAPRMMARTAGWMPYRNGRTSGSAP